MSLAFLVLLSLQARPVQTDTIPTTVFCPRCRIEREHLVTLDKDYAIRPGDVAIIRNEVVLVADGGPNPILRFDLQSGRYLGEVGRRGRGPGEFSWPIYLSNLPGDSLFVFDNTGLTFSVLAPGTYRYTRGAPVTVARPSAALLNGSAGKLWVAASVGNAQQAGFPLHLFEQNGAWVKSFGSERPILRWNDHAAFTRRLTTGPKESVWAIPRYGPLTLETYDKAGNLVRRMAYSAEWVPENGRPQRIGDPPPPERPPFAVVSESEVWILTLVPADNWRTGITTAKDPTHGAKTPMVGDIAKLFDTVVEVFDLVQRRVSFRMRTDEAVIKALPGGIFVTYRENAGGVPDVRLERWRLRGLP